MSLRCSGHILHGRLWPPCKEVQAAGYPSPRFSLCRIITHSYSHPFCFTQHDTAINSSHCIQMPHSLSQPTNSFYHIVACICSALLPSLHEPASTHYYLFIVRMHLKISLCHFDNFRLILDFRHTRFALDSWHVQFTLDATLTWPISLPYSL